MPNKIIHTAILFFLYISALSAQVNGPVRYVQVSGMILDASHNPVPGVSVISRKLRRATISETTGIYSITSTPGDTIYYRALGFKRYHTIIPEEYSDRHCKVDIILEPDTIRINEITILPWKTYNEFLKDVTKERPVDPIIENMNDNIASIYVAISNQTNPAISPEAGFKYAMEQNFNTMATRNQYPYNNLLNPFAWSKFIRDLKNGLLKNQKFNKPVKAKVRKKKRKR
ncbi:MAG TPA: carboxypeptidase-like regulatory domain-containing protein [Bacteroidales bacterium]|nr:carboxypeptidase-like regulatory domain-containing protein [Bacteroidales bacterium]